MFHKRAVFLRSLGLRGLQERFPFAFRQIQASAQAVRGPELTFLATSSFPVPKLAIAAFAGFALTGLLSWLLTRLLPWLLTGLLSRLLTGLLTLRHLLGTLLGQ